MKCTLQALKPITGVYPTSAFGGIEIIGDIEYGVTDYIYWRYNNGVPEEVRRAKLYSTNKGDTYFRTPSGRIYLSNIQCV